MEMANILPGMLSSRGNTGCFIMIVSDSEICFVLGMEKEKVAKI